MAREHVTRATPRETPRLPATEKRDASDFCETYQTRRDTPRKKTIHRHDFVKGPHFLKKACRESTFLVFFGSTRNSPHKFLKVNTAKWKVQRQG